MKLFTVLAALVLAASALVIQVDVIAEDHLPACLPVGHRCIKDKQCCSKACHYINKPYGFCGANDDDNDDDAETHSQIKLRFPIPPLKHNACAPAKASCGDDQDCCSHVCVKIRDAGQCVGDGPDKPQCLPAGASCGTGKDCCSNLCLRVRGAGRCFGTGPPPPQCFPSGHECEKDEQCCSQICGDKKCIWEDEL